MQISNQHFSLYADIKSTLYADIRSPVFISCRVRISPYQDCGPEQDYCSKFGNCALGAVSAQTVLKFKWLQKTSFSFLWAVRMTAKLSEFQNKKHLSIQPPLRPHLEKTFFKCRSIDLYTFRHDIPKLGSNIFAVLSQGANFVAASSIVRFFGMFCKSG